ncbi:hypothetical protein EDC04DRAFT_2570292 [Pisolithus marmoratus]|nr:hypothetical protein EDC04DRAFT_2570292 [Pisolithus marmoratus]
MSEKDELEVQHRQITSWHNFDKVNGQWQIKTQCQGLFTYPPTESKAEDTETAHRPPSSHASPTSSSTKSVLWLCNRCLKYIMEGQLWEMHAQKCDRRHPPVRKVYQHRAHAIWEVDGAIEKVCSLA